MAWGTPRAWATGEIVTAANMNTYISNDLSFLYDRVSRRTYVEYSTVTSNSSTTFASTGLSASLACQDSASKIRIQFAVHGCYVAATSSILAGLHAKLYKDGSAWKTLEDGTYYGNTNNSGSLSALGVGPVVGDYTDTPGDTSSHTYAVYFACHSTGASSQVYAQLGSVVSTMTLEEITS